MKEFVVNILPFVVLGISLAIICINMYNHKTKDNTYVIEGMGMGIAFGVYFSYLFPDFLDLSTLIPMGLLVGEACGICIKKNKI